MKKTKAPKGNLKISSFFTKNTSPKSVLNPISSNSTSRISPNKRKLDDQSDKQPSKKLCGSTTPKKHNSPNKNSAVTTPKSGSKRSPNKPKLFERSPKRIGDFRVEIINNFFLSPSKCDKNVAGAVVKDLTPSKSDFAKSSEQDLNFTPKKPSQSPHHPVISPKSTVNLSFELETATYVNGVKKKVKSPVKNGKNKENLKSGFNLMDFDDDDFSLIAMKLDSDLNLQEPKHCKILEVKYSRARTALKLESTKSQALAWCNIEGFWNNLSLKIGDKIFINAFKDSNSEWLVNNENGLLVLEPDHLISCTSVVNSLFCKRRSVLSEKFSNFEGTNKAMVIGNIVHYLLQAALRDKLTKEEEILVVMERHLKSTSVVRKLYESGSSFNEIVDEIKQFIPRIVEFIHNYLEGKSKINDTKGNWTGKISAISDIEENIWCTELGIKGKVDATIKSGLRTMPLELKTGRATVSIEHQGQVILYVMMMSKLGYSAVSSGLLLYLREGVLKEIPVSHKEKRDLLMLRNELAFYLTRPSSTTNKSLALELPEPINHERACSRCPFNKICTSMLKYENYDISQNKAIATVQQEVTSHLSEKHIEYFIHWTNLLSLEERNSDGKSIRDIYTKSPIDREKTGKCISNLKVTSCSVTMNGLYEQKFEKSQKNTNFFASGVLECSYIVVSTDLRPAVGTGFVNYIDSNTLTATLDRDLLKKFPQNNFHIDTYDSSAMQSLNLISLSILLENTKRAQRLRELIIDKAEPRFLNKLPRVIADKGTPILRPLNRIQQRAVLKAMAVEDFLLIKGMPGSGKTQTIVALVQLLVKLDKTVLITSHTNSAVDNVCLKLQKVGVDVLRLGSESRIDEKLKFRSEHYLTKDCTSPEQLEEVYNSAKVIAVTCLGSGHPLLSKRVLDYCIVDESTQVVQTSTIRALYSCKCFILIGDPDQLTPVIKNKDAVKAGMAETLFERLSCPGATITLNLNYRMNRTITALANALTYKGDLQVGNDKIANATLKLTTTPSLQLPLWVSKALDSDLKAAVQFIDTGAVWKLPKKMPSWFMKTEADGANINIYEVAIVKILVGYLIKSGISGKNIGVIATYRTQVAQISLLLNDLNVDVSTVDQFQGKDKSVIIYSCCVSRDISESSQLKYELLEDRKRLNVAITRAKHKLILIGDKDTLSNYSTFKILLGAIHNKYILSLNQEVKDFNTLLDF